MANRKADGTGRDIVEVALWGQPLGTVTASPAGQVTFTFDKEWLRSGIEVAPLLMPLRSEPHEVPASSPLTFRGLPPLFADALPDAFGTALMDIALAESGRDPAAVGSLDRLAFVGDRAMGALEFGPDGAVVSTAPVGVEVAQLVAAARLVVQGDVANLDPGGAESQRLLIDVGATVGGARPKGVVAYDRSAEVLHTPWGERPAGWEDWLIKLDGVTSQGLDDHGSDLGDAVPYGRIEFAYSEMAGAAGITMEPCRLLEEGPRGHFMTRRFDRGPSGAKAHVVSLCAMAHVDFNMRLAHSYDQYFDTVVALGLGEDALEEAYRRMVFNVVAVNRDDHTKNLSFLRWHGGPWELTPAFDVTHAYRADSVWTARHLMSVNGRFEDIELSDLYAVAARHRIEGSRRIVADVFAAVDRWPAFARAAGVPEWATRRIREDQQAFLPD